MQEIMYDEIHLGDSADRVFVVSEKDILQFAEVSHDHNPIHIDPEFAKQSLFGQQISHGMLGASYISAVAGNQLPGPNTLYLSQTLSFRAPVFIGDTLTVEVTVLAKKDRGMIISLLTQVFNQHGKLVIDGEAVAKKVR